MIKNRAYQRCMTRRDFLWLASVTTAAPVLSGCTVNPVTGESQFMIMSEAQEIAIDQQQSPHQFSNDYGSIQNKSVNQYLESIGNKLAANTHRKQIPYSFRAVNANYINAYAFPGGSIAVTRGILVNLNNESELAGLLGHELGHINARHTAERMSKSTLLNLAMAGVGIAASTVSEELGSLSQQVGQFGGAALLAHYSRDDERQADSLGMEYMVKGLYSPEGMVGLMTLLRSLSKHQPSSMEMMFSTHPMSNERYQTAIQLSQSRYRFALSQEQGRERYMDNIASLRKLKPVITALDEAERLLTKKSFRDANVKATNALKKAPSDYSALIITGKTFTALEQPEKAKRYFEKATKVYPKEAQGHFLLGITLLELKKPETALRQFMNYDQILPGNPNTLFLQGISYENMQNIPEAAQRYSSFLRKVNRGQQAQHAYQRLVDWGYIKQPSPAG